MTEEEAKAVWDEYRRQRKEWKEKLLSTSWYAPGFQQTPKMRAINEAQQQKRRKLVDREVREIRQLYAEGVSPTKIARKYGYSKGNLWALCHGKKYKHVK